MFFREKDSKKSKNTTLQLVENIRNGKNIRQNIVISLGVNFDIPENDRKDVAKAVEQKLLGQETLFLYPQISAIADRIVKRIQTDGKWKTKKKKAKTKTYNEKTKENGEHIEYDEKTIESDEHIEKVYIDRVNHGHDRILGPLLIGHTFWQRLGFPDILKQCGFRPPQINTAEISVLDRLIAQDSEHAIPSWIRTTAVEDLIDKAAEDFADDRFYNISDKLLDNKYFIEEQLYQREKSLFNLNNSVYLYDLTNTYFEGLCKANPKAKFSKNQKEKRTDCRQIVIALVLDQEGFIRRHYTFDGKMTDVKSLEHILKALKADFQDAQLPTIIMDRGLVCDDNIKLLNSYDLKYIVITRSGEEKQFIDDFVNADFKVLKENKNNKIEVLIKKEADETFLLCKSKLKKAKEQSMRNQAELRLDKDISNLANSIKTGKRVDPLSIEQAIGRIKERHSKVSHYYEIEYVPFSFDYQIPKDEVVCKRLFNSLLKLKEKADQYKTSHITVISKLEELSHKYPQDYEKITVTVKEPYFNGEPTDEKKGNLQALDGNYLLKTNRNDLTDADIWNMYVMLTRVENAFRKLKKELKIRPNYHQKEIRVDGHVNITILAYHLLHSIEYTLREHNCRSSWDTIKRVVSSHTYSTIVLPTPNGTVIHLRKAGILEPIHEKIYEMLKVNVDDLPAKKVEA